MAEVGLRAWQARSSEATFALAAGELEEPGLTPFGIADRLLEGGGLKKVLATGKPVADFEAYCSHLALVPHPGILSALTLAAESGADLSGVVSIRGHICDAGSLCALLALLPANRQLTTLKFWHCSLPADAVELLRGHLPPSITTLAVEADETPVSLLLTMPALKVASLRCCTFPAAEAVPLGAALGANSTLTSLSLYCCLLGDAAIAPIAAALRLNASLLALNLAKNMLTDVATEALLGAFTDPAPPDQAEGEEGEQAEATDVAADEAVGGAIGTANRTLTALNLSGNLIGVQV